uniref:Uncharacterized protein n=1 Tax=Arundo donax TaxID=35708 RepID=A0A0A9E6J0_ARUDO
MLRKDMSSEAQPEIHQSSYGD